MARDIQAGLDFQSRPHELFEGKEMGEDTLRILGEYRSLLQTIRENIGRERKALTEALRWEKSLGLGLL